MNASDPGRHDVPTLVVDDTLLYRILITEAVDLLPGFKVVGKAENGRVGMDLVRRLHPKLVLLDLEMPIMNGFEMLERLRREHPDVTVVIISALSKRGGHVTLDALHSGAFDFITKPEGEDASASRVELRSQLRLKLAPLRQDRRSAAPAAAAAATRSGSSHRARPGPASRLASRPQPVASPAPVSDSVRGACDAARRQRAEVIGIGVSTGGPQALSTVLKQLKRGLPPICIVQHMPGPFLSAMAEKLDEECELHVKEAVDGESLRRDTVYIAPGSRQMAIHRRGAQYLVQLRNDPPENHCLPAVDYLLRSLVEPFGRRALGIVMTGMGVDGARGLMQMKGAGALTIAQNEASCTVYGMPKQAVRIGAAAYELPLNGIAQVIGSAG